MGTNRNSSTPQQATSKEARPLWKGLYLFAGKERHADVKHFVRLLADERGVDFCLEEWDILRGPEQDLTDDASWRAIKDRISNGEFDFVIVAPPCNTFSRARHNRAHPGPKPLRSWDYLKGFPWLRDVDLQKVRQANLLVERSLEACLSAHSVGSVFLLEHPEQLGIAQGLVPASIWDWEEFKDLQKQTGLLQMAIFQCEFGAPTSKPTRLATNAINACDFSPLAKFMGPYQMDSEGKYLGPLPLTCPHKGHSHRLIGKAEDGSWNTGPAATYPPGLCQTMADLVTHHLIDHSTGAGVKGVNQVVELAKGDGEDPFHGRMDQAAKDNLGEPMTCGWMLKPKSFTDGGGLCSPGRWLPKDRGVGLDDDKKEWINKLALKIRTFVVKKIGDLKQATFRLATGHMKEPPFSDEDMKKLREEWFQLLGGSDSLRVVTPCQPFYLFAVEATMKKMGDEDFAIISQNEGDNYVSGRRVGVEKPIPPAPLVFRPKRKEKKYDNSEFVPEAMNYSSAEGAKEQIQKQFEEEEKMGWMYPLSEAEARKRFGQTLRIASLAAIPKDEKAVRVLFDGTHSVQVNNEIKMEDQLEFPTPAELARVMEISREQDWGVILAIAADIMKAHRRFLHDERDHGYLCCRADSDSKVVWANRVGTFGVACAALHFGRLAGAVFRTVIRLLNQQPCFQLLFADDLKWIVGGPSKYLDLWTLIVGWIMMGTPFSWRKFRGGLELDYVGFWTDYARFRLGLSEKRARWVVQTVSDLEQSGFVMAGRGFSELLGRLGFAAQAVPWLRPLLGSLYAWDGVLSPFMAARVPGLVAATLRLIKERFLKGDFTAPCWSPAFATGESFRTDAKCETGLVVIAGWELATQVGGGHRWFSFPVTAQEAPWLYYRGVDVQKMSTSAELLATYGALHAFGHLAKGMDYPSENRLCLISAGTDNLANEQLSRKRMTTKMPLGLLMLQFYTKLWDNGIWIRIKWRPRDENQEADALTNGKFDGFAEDQRIPMSYKDLDMDVVDRLQDTLKAFDDATSELRGGGVKLKGLTKRQKVDTKTDW